MRFTSHETLEINRVLWTFIAMYRDSNDPADIVAVASAIRSYIANMSSDELSSVSLLLDARSRTPVSLDVELEVAKMVVRKLTANPPQEPSQHPDVAALLGDLAETYSKERLLTREKYGAIALNSIIGLVLLRSDLAEEQIGKICKLMSGWFRELLARRLAGMREDWLKRFAPGTIAPNLEFIDKALSQLGGQSTTRAG